MNGIRVLLVYGTRYGHTEKVAERIAASLGQAGAQVTTYCGDRVPEHFHPQHFDAAIIAGSVIGGKHQRYLAHFVKEHVRWLNHVPSAFVSVSGAAASVADGSRERARQQIEAFLRVTGWQPSTAEAVGGAYSYSRYNPFMRWFMRRIAAKDGVPTDGSSDVVLTDWPRLDAFAGDFVRTATPKVSAPAESELAPR